MDCFLVLHYNRAVTVLDSEIEAILWIAFNAADGEYRYKQITMHRTQNKPKTKKDEK